MSKRGVHKTNLASIMVDDEALVPAVEVLVVVDLHSELLKHSLICTFAFCMHSCADVVQYTHNAWRILPMTTTNP